MKNNRFMIFIQATLLLLPTFAFGQVTFIYDQQSSDESHILEGTAPIQQNQPFGQSFTPAFSTVGFIRLELVNGLGGNLSTAAIDVSLRANSITGTVLGTSQQVIIPSGDFSGPVNFLFATPVSVTPGTTYYFQPVVLDNNNIVTDVDAYNYSAGEAYANGTGFPGANLWFREGITVIPEPTLVSLLLVGGVAAFGLRRRN